MKKSEAREALAKLHQEISRLEEILKKPDEKTPQEMSLLASYTVNRNGKQIGGYRLQVGLDGLLRSSAERLVSEYSEVCYFAEGVIARLFSSALNTLLRLRKCPGSMPVGSYLITFDTRGLPFVATVSPGELGFFSPKFHSLEDATAAIELVGEKNLQEMFLTLSGTHPAILEAYNERKKN